MIGLQVVKETSIEEEYMLEYYKSLLSGNKLIARILILMTNLRINKGNEPSYDLGLPGLPEEEKEEKEEKEEIIADIVVESEELQINE